jgi:hypothetical protein
VVGTQRILDLPPVQVVTDQVPFVRRELELVPAAPEPGEDAEVCVVLHNRAGNVSHARVYIGVGDRLSTAPDISIFEEKQVEVPAGSSARVCSKSFSWTGDRSLKTIIRQDGYAEQEIGRNVGELALPAKGAASYTLEVRNPRAEPVNVQLIASRVGLPGWKVALPGSLALKGGEGKEITIQVEPATSAQSDLSQTRPGDAGRIEIWVHTQDGELLGGAWLNVWERERIERHLYLPSVRATPSAGPADASLSRRETQHPCYLPRIVRDD